MEVVSPASETPYQDVSPSAGADNPKVEWNHLLDTARQHEYGGDPVQGLALREQMLLLAKKTFGDTAVEVQRSCESFVVRCNQIAMAKLKANQPDEAFDLLRKAEILTDKNGILALCPAARLRCRAVTLNNIGLFYRHRDQNNAALSYLEQALEIESGNSDFRSENPVATLLNLCAVLSKLGRYQLALGYAKQALVALRRHKKSKDSARYGGETAPSRQTMFAVAHHAAGCQYEGLRNYQKAAEEYIAAIVASREADDSDSSVGRSYLQAYRSVIQKARASGRFSDASLPTLPPEKKRIRGGGMNSFPPPQRRQVRQSFPQVSPAPQPPRADIPRRPHTASTFEPYKQPSLIEIQNAIHPQPPPKKRPSTGGTAGRTSTTSAWGNSNSKRPPSAKKTAKYAYDLVYKPASIRGLSTRNKQAFEELDEMTKRHLLRIAEEPLPLAPSPPQENEAATPPNPQQPPPSLREDFDKKCDLVDEFEASPQCDLTEESLKPCDGETLQTLESSPIHPTPPTTSNISSFSDVTDPRETTRREHAVLTVQKSWRRHSRPSRSINDCGEGLIASCDVIENDEQEEAEDEKEIVDEGDALHGFLEIEASHIEAQQTTYSSPLASSASQSGLRIENSDSQIAALAEALDRSIASQRSVSSLLEQRRDEKEGNNESPKDEEKSSEKDSVISGKELRDETNAVEPLKADVQREEGHNSGDVAEEELPASHPEEGDLDDNSRASDTSEQPEEPTAEDDLNNYNEMTEQSADVTKEQIAVRETQLEELFDTAMAGVVTNEIPAEQQPESDNHQAANIINFTQLSEDSGLGLLMRTMDVLPERFPPADEIPETATPSDPSEPQTPEHERENRLLKERTYAAVNVQRVFRGFLGNKRWKQVQADFITAKQQQHAEYVTRQTIIIQTMCRSKLSCMINTVKVWKRLLNGMKLLQARYRGFDARVKFRKLKDEWQEKQKIIQFGSATRLQGWWRRMLIRKQKEAKYRQQWDELVSERKPLYAIGRIKLWWKWMRFEHRLVYEVLKVTTENQRKKQILEEVENLQKRQHESAVCIQQAYRKYISERQLEFRRMKDLARKIAYLECEGRDYAARVLQRFSRIVHSVSSVRRRRKELAEFEALKIWKQQKLAQQEAEVQVMHRLELAAIRIQKVWRGFSVRLKSFRKRVAELLEWEDSLGHFVTNIIKVWKGHSTRLKIEKPLAEHRAIIKQKAALVIQRFGRGHRDRKEVSASSRQQRSSFKIQKSFRTFKKRRHTMFSNVVQMFAQTAISILLRSSKITRQQSALTIQKWVRTLQSSVFVKNALEERREQRKQRNDAEYAECQAVLIQSLWRGYYCRKILKQRRVAIQSASRCRLSRTLVSHMRFNHRIGKAATSLRLVNAAARGKLSQLRVAEMMKSLIHSLKIKFSIDCFASSEAAHRNEIEELELSDRQNIRPPAMKPTPPLSVKPPKASTAIRGLSEKGVRRFRAAITIQKNWKVFVAKCAADELRNRPTNDAAVRIQQFVRCRVSTLRVRCLQGKLSVFNFQMSARRELAAVVVQTCCRHILSLRMSQELCRNRAVEETAISDAVGDIIQKSIFEHIDFPPQESIPVRLTRPSLKDCEREEVLSIIVISSLASLCVSLTLTELRDQAEEAIKGSEESHCTSSDLIDSRPVEEIQHEDAETSSDKKISQLEAAVRIQHFARRCHSRVTFKYLYQLRASEHKSIVQNEAATCISCCYKMWRAKLITNKTRTTRHAEQQAADRRDEEAAAAILIQSSVKGFIQRQKFCRMFWATDVMKKRRSLRLKIQERHNKCNDTVREEAGRVIKFSLQRSLVLKKLAKKRIEVQHQRSQVQRDDAGGSLTRWYKRKHASGEIRKTHSSHSSIIKDEDAATLIQSFFKGWLTRKRVQKDLQTVDRIHSYDAVDEMQLFAAVRLQSTGRAFITRKQLK